MSKQAAQGRSDRRTNAGSKSTAKSAMRHEIARADRALRGVPPVLSHLLAVSQPALVTEEIVARLRGNLSSLARQLLEVASDDSETDGLEANDPGEVVHGLAGNSVILSFCFALAIESETTERLERREQIDPVLSPLLQELIASPVEITAELAMKTLAAQSRFVQHQRRMALSLNELPAEIFHEVLRQWSAAYSAKGDTPRAVERLRRDYDEADSRSALLARLVGAMGKGAIAALDLEHAGFALFATALAQISGQPRELVVISSHEGQVTRLLLALRAAGLEADAIRQQCVFFAPLARLPAEVCELSAADATAMLAEASAPQSGGPVA